MLRNVRHAALRWPARLLLAVLVCALMSASVPRIVVHAHAHANVAHHHDATSPADSYEHTPTPDPGSPHAHDACGVSVLAAAPSPASLAFAISSTKIADQGTPDVPSMPPEFLHRPPIA